MKVVSTFLMTLWLSIATAQERNIRKDAIPEVLATKILQPLLAKTNKKWQMERKNRAEMRKHDDDASSSKNNSKNNSFSRMLGDIFKASNSKTKPNKFMPTQNKLLPKLPSMAQSFLMKTAMKRNTIIDENSLIGKAAVTIGAKGRQLEPDWAFDWHGTVDSIVELFVSILTSFGLSFDIFTSPEDYCNWGGAEAETSACIESIESLLGLISNVLTHPWVILDFVFFIYTNLVFDGYTIFDLFFAAASDWDTFREYLHDIPKDGIYYGLIPWIIGLICSIDDGLVCEILPFALMYGYYDLFYSLSNAFDLESPISFTELLMVLTETPDEYVEYVIAEIDFYHTEVCYVMSLEKMYIDIKSSWYGDEMDMTGIPFCGPAELANNVGAVIFDFLPNDDYDFSIVVAEGLTPPPGLENPWDKAFFKYKNSGVKTISCLKLAPHWNRPKICKKSNAPEGYKNPKDTCPSICCEREENLTDKFLVDKATMETKFCYELIYMSETERDAMCNMAISSPEYKPAFITCPTSCGICQLPEM